MISHVPIEGEWLPLEITLETGAAEPKLELAWHTAEDRARARCRCAACSCVGESAAGPDARRPRAQIPELAGGNWLHGQRIFSLTRCLLQCHQVNGRGGKVGPICRI